MRKKPEIDFSDPLNYAFLYLLYEKLGVELKLKSSDIITWNETEIHTELQKRSYENTPSKTYVQRLLKILQLQHHLPSYQKFTLSKRCVDQLCSHIRIKNEKQNWISFTDHFKKHAENLLKKKPECYELYNFTIIKKAKKSVKALVALNHYGLNVGTLLGIKNEIIRVISDNLLSVKEDDNILIDIHEEKSKILNAKEAQKLAKKENLDLVIYGKIIGENESNFNLELGYIVNNTEVIKRLNLSTPYGKIHSLSKTSILELLMGHFQGNLIESAIFLLALKNYLENNVHLAINYLEKIPEQNRQSEIWFILGVCYNDQGNNEKATSCWTNAHYKGHLRASVNLALQYELTFKKSVSEEERKEIQSKIKLLLPSEKLIEASSEIQLKAAMIFVTIKEDCLAKELYSFISKDETSSHFKEATFFLAILEAKFNTVSKMIDGSISLNLKKAGLYYLFKSPNPTPVQRIHMLDELLASVSESDEEAEKFKSQIVYYRELERMPTGGLANGLAIDELFDSNKNVQSVAGSNEIVDGNGNYQVKNNGSVHIIEKTENGCEAKFLSSKQDKAISELRENLQSYLMEFRGISSNDTYLVFETNTIRKTKLKEYPSIRLYFAELDDFLELPQNADGMLSISREQLEELYLEGIPEKLSLKIFYPDPEGHFVDSETSINLAIPELGALRDEIEHLTLFVPYQNADEYYRAIRNYLEEFHGRLDPFEMIDWLCEVGLAYEDVRIFQNA